MMEWLWVLQFFSWIIVLEAVTYNVDMENSMKCSMGTSVLVLKNDIYNIYAEPRQDSKGTLARCTIKFQGDGNRNLKIFVRELNFRECQIFVRIYDGDVVYMLNAKYEFGCTSPIGNTYLSTSSSIAISLEKADPASTAYKFYLRVGTSDGPDLGVASDRVGASIDTLSAGVIAGIVVACVLVIIVVVAIMGYCIYVYKQKQEQKAAMAASTSILAPTGSMKDGGSSHHSTHSTHSTHASIYSTLVYPAFRNTITEKNANCHSIDTKSYDSDDIDAGTKPTKHSQPVMVKNIELEFDAMRKGILRENYKKERAKETSHQHELSYQEAQLSDRKTRALSAKGLGRNRSHQNEKPLLNEANLRAIRNNGRSHNSGSSHAARDKGRNYSESLGKVSTRSSRSKHKSHSPSRSAGSYRENRADSDYYSDRYEEDQPRGRRRSRSDSSKSRPHRTSSTGSNSYSKKGYYNDEDMFENNSRRHHSRERSDSNFHRDRDHGSGRQRSKSHESDRNRI